MWGPAGDGKFVIAAAAAMAVTFFELYRSYGRTPLRDVRAIWWFTLVAIIDASVAGLVILINPKSSVLQFSAPNFAAWVAIGVAVPLGLRKPVWKPVGIRRIKVDPGITYVYDIVRGWMNFNVDVRMSNLERQGRAAQVNRMQQNGWTAGPLFCLIQTTVQGLHTPDDSDRERIIGSARLALGFADDGKRLEGLANVIRTEGLSSVRDEVKKRRPTADEISEGEAALAAAATAEPAA
jgi:hypothetical protein